MRDAWNDLWKRLRATEGRDRVYQRLMELYGDNRFYHTMEHIANGLGQLERARDLTTQYTALEFAWWFHDAVCVPGAVDNEERSANLAYAVARQSGLPHGFGKKAAKLILATKEHNPRSRDGKIISDVDLSPLGSPWEQFEENSLNIRNEYGEYSDGEFNAMSTKALQGFLDREHIFLLPLYRDQFEEQARENIRRALAEIE